MIIEGQEKSIEFFIEEQSVSPGNYGTDIPSEYYLECIEDTIVCAATPEMESEMFGIYPEIESECRKIGEKMIADYQASYTNYKISSAEERYLNLMKHRPELIQRVPQYQLASYLGITPESLSRIRKRVAKKL